MAKTIEKSSYSMYDTDSAEWKQYSFETMAESVIFNDGKNAEEKLGSFDTSMSNTVNNLETKIDNLTNKMGTVQFKYDSTNGAPMWSTDGANWYFFKHWHIGAAGVPDKNLKNDNDTFTKPTGCFTKMTKKYHVHSSPECYTTQRQNCMRLVDHPYDPGAKQWICYVCGKWSGDTGTSTSPTDPCYHDVQVFTCTKTEGSTVDKTYYACGCGKSAGSYVSDKGTPVYHAHTEACKQYKSGTWVLHKDFYKNWQGNWEYQLKCDTCGEIAYQGSANNTDYTSAGGIKPKSTHFNCTFVGYICGKEEGFQE